MILSCEPGCTIAKPPDTGTGELYPSDLALSPTEELFAPSCLLDDFDQARLQLLDGRDVVGKHAHLARLPWYVDLHPASLGQSRGLDAAGRINSP